MDLGEFKQTVASFVGRDPDYFITNTDGGPGPDKLLIAINNAKIFLQRQIDFELCREFVDLTYTVGRIGGGIRLTEAVKHQTSYPVLPKKIVNLYTPHGFARMLPLRQKTFRGLSDLIRGSADRGGMWMPDCRGSVGGVVPYEWDGWWTAVWGHTFRDPIWYVHGRGVYLYPQPCNFRGGPYGSPCPADPDPGCPPTGGWKLPFVGDVVRLLPPYTSGQTVDDRSLSNVDGVMLADDDQHDFLLNECYDYMLWRAIAELNVFLKEEDQLTISQSKMNEALENIRQWNADLVNAATDIE